MATKLWEGTKFIGRGTISGEYLEVHQCGTCGVVFAVEHDVMEARRDDGEGWRCPNGHSFVFSGDTLQQKLEKAQQALARERESRRATQDLLAHEERSNATLRGHITRKKRELARTKAGVCPVDGCHRHFQNLERHIATKHPTFKP